MRLVGTIIYTGRSGVSRHGFFTSEIQLKQNMISESNIRVPEFRSLIECLDNVLAKGYTKDYIPVDGAIRCIQSNRSYRPHEVNIVNFFRFEGISDPAYKAILYVIETADGGKGAVVDAYGAYSSPELDEFMKSVDGIHKKQK